MPGFGLTYNLYLSVFFVLYFVFINIAGFYAMWLDKKKAKRNEWRISEKTLFTLALIGGSAGTFLGMRLCRHKTKHWYFVWGMPAIIVCQVLLLIFIIKNI